MLKQDNNNNKYVKKQDNNNNKYVKNFKLCRYYLT